MGDGRRGIASTIGYSRKLTHDLDLPYNRSVECLHIFSRYPIFAVRFATRILYSISIEVVAPYMKARYKAGTALGHVPIASDLNRIFFGGHRIEDRLIGQARREAS